MAAPRTNKTKPAPRAAESQLGLDFSSEPAPQENPAAPPELVEPASDNSVKKAAPKSGASPSSKNGSLMDRAPRWIAPSLGSSWVQGRHALAIACSIQNASLARGLLELPEPWDLNAPFDPEVGSSEGSPTPLAHLLTYRSPGYGYRLRSQPNEDFSVDEVSAVALSMVERGADYLIEADGGMSALTLCAQNGRQDFIEALANHPDFHYERLREVRVGSLPPFLLTREIDDSESESESESEGAALDRARSERTAAAAARTPLLGFLVLGGQMRSARALIEDAGFPINALDPVGRLPIGYCRDVDTTERMLALGADPSLEDAQGLNALARVQDVTDTSTREKMIGLIAARLLKGVKANSSAMVHLQSQNVAALMEAAENQPKTSLLKVISSFKFDVSKVLDPKSGETPLAAALRGGRLANANYLIERGCDLNAADLQGVGAGSHLLAGRETSNGPSAENMGKWHGSNIDFEHTSKRGWPTAVEAAFLMGASPHNSGRYSLPTVALRSALAQSSRAQASWVQAGDGTTMMEAFAQGVCFGHGSARRHGAVIRVFLEISQNLKVSGSIDAALAAALLVAEAKSEDIGNGYGASEIINELGQAIHASSEACPKSSAVLARPRGKKLASNFARAHSALWACIESREIQAMNLGTVEAPRKGVRL